MHSKIVLAAAALVASVAAYDLPTCWTSCFEQYEVDSEGCLCTSELGKVVSTCIDSGCSSANATAYTAWLSSYCNAAPVSSNTWAVPSSTYAIPSTSVSSIPLAYSSATGAYSSSVVVVSSAVPTAYPSGSAPAGYSTAPASETSPYSSICTEATTMIWRSSTSTAQVQITHYPGGGWATYPAGNATGGVASSTTAWAGGYTGAPATGGAARVGAAAAVIGGAIAVALF